MKRRSQNKYAHQSARPLVTLCLASSRPYSLIMSSHIDCDDACIGYQDRVSRILLFWIFFLFFEQKSYSLEHLNVSASENQFFVCGFDAYLGKLGSS